MTRYICLFSVLLTVCGLVPGCDSADPGPRAAFSAEGRIGPAPLTVQFTDTSIAGGQIIESWAWTFGDGESSTERSPAHTFTADGSYNVTLTIVTDQGVERTRTEVGYVVVGDLFARRFGGAGIDDGQDLIESDDENLVIAGASTAEGETTTDMYLAKTDTDGVLLWDVRFGGLSADAGRAVVQGSNGDLVIAGFTRSVANRNQLLIVRTDANGNERWSSTFGGQEDIEGFDLVRVLEGEPEAETFTIAATYRPLGSFDRDLYLVHIDAAGAEIWNTRIESPGDEEIRAIAATEDGGYIIVGTSAPPSSATTDIYAVRTDASGQLVWARNYGDVGNDRGYEVIATGEGFLIGGSFGTLTAQGIDLIALHIDGEGDEIWSAILGGSGTEQAWGILPLNSGGYLASGFTTTATAGAEDAFLVRIADNGDEVWRRSLGGSRLDILRKAVALPDGFALIGSTASYGAGQRDIYLVKTNLEGYGPSEPGGMAGEGA